MNKPVFLIIILVLCLTCLYSAAISQETNHNNKSSDEAFLMKSAYEMLRTTKLCALITKDSLDHMHIRTMQPFPPQNDLTIWMGTNKNSRKINDIRSNPEVMLYYSMQDESGYVVLYGHADLIDDPDLKNKYWNEEWKDFYPDRSSYILIKVSPDSLEILNTRKAIFGDKKTWKVPVINIE